MRRRSNFIKSKKRKNGAYFFSLPNCPYLVFKGIPSKLSLLLGITPRNLAGVIYFAKYLVLSVNEK